MVMKFPIGIQSFESLRSEGFVYVDKNALIKKLVSEGKCYFLGRPRRFGNIDSKQAEMVSGVNFLSK